MSKLPRYHAVHHPHQPGAFLMHAGSEENVESALLYGAKAGDVFLCSYLKCGITWLSNLVWRVTHNGEGFKEKIRNYIPCLEFDGSDVVEASRKVGAYHFIKTHFPYKWIPKHLEAKYIFITREPKDTCVSHYYHMKGFPDYCWQDGKFDDVVDGFLHGKLDSSDYFAMLNEWYKVKDDPAVLFILYEDLLTSTKTNILKIAEFLGQQYVDGLSANNNELLDKIVAESSVAKMKQEDTLWYYGERTFTFVRKGIIGDWKNHLSRSQAAAIDERLREASDGNGSDHLWLQWK